VACCLDQNVFASCVFLGVCRAGGMLVGQRRDRRSRRQMRCCSKHAAQPADPHTPCSHLAGEVAREGSTNELALLVAEYTLVEEQLAVLASTVGPASMPFVGDDVLEKLAVDVPDLRIRVGVNDQVVFGGSGFSTTRLQLQMKESVDKVLEAINFLLRGVRLLGSDVSNAGRLFGKAALGGWLGGVALCLLVLRLVWWSGGGAVDINLS
jgi:hypothetical protein